LSIGGERRTIFPDPSVYLSQFNLSNFPLLGTSKYHPVAFSTRNLHTPIPDIKTLHGYKSFDPSTPGALNALNYQHGDHIYSAKK
jgi:hypothetical protein